MDDTTYPVSELPFEAGARLLLFSDGLVEQTGAGSELFGMERVLESLASSASVDEDLSRLEAALRSYAGTTAYADDLTIASFQRI